MTRATHPSEDPVGNPSARGLAGSQLGTVEIKPRQSSPDRELLKGEPRVLVVTDSPALAAKATRALSGRATCLLARDVTEAISIIAGSERGQRLRIHAALIDHASCADASLQLVAELAKRGAGVVLAAKRADTNLVAQAAANGCRDVIARNLRVHELSRFLLGAAGLRSPHVARARGGRRMRRLDRLYGRDMQMTTPRARQTPGNCTDQVGGNMECAAAMNQVTTATEFKTLIKHELDIEQLLRSTLEFVLARSGPTNAAVFLPTTSGDYSLGAYVNYDCPKETVDMLLDHMANTVAPKFEKTDSIVQLPDARRLEDFAGGDSAWLGDSGVIGFACRHDTEVLAIVMLFRDRLSPFGPLLVDQLKTIGELFASQLAHVIHVHHRHLPKDKWGCIGDPPECDDEDLAA
jgi:DNA-binding response OmpR family regulator